MMLYKTYNDKNGNIRSGDIDIFLEASIDNYVIAQENQLRSNLLNKDKQIVRDPTTGRDIEVTALEHLDELFELHNRISKLTIQGIVLLSTFLEALINEIGIIELGSKYFEENLDKLNVVAKWEIVLKLIYGKSIDKGSHHFDNIEKIIKQRNNLVHYKTTQINNSNRNNQIDYFDILHKGLTSLTSFMENLKKIDAEKKLLKFYHIDEQLKRIKAITQQ